MVSRRMVGGGLLKSLMGFKVSRLNLRLMSVTVESSIIKSCPSPGFYLMVSMTDFLFSFGGMPECLMLNTGFIYFQNCNLHCDIIHELIVEICLFPRTQD